MCAFRGGCDGDSGGGLVIQNTKGWDMISYLVVRNYKVLGMYFRFYELIGIQSYNLGCHTIHKGKLNRKTFN